MSEKNPGKIAKAGVDLLKRLVFEKPAAGAVEAPSDRRDALRTPVIGEVDMVVLDPAGQPMGHTRVFIRDLSKSGCGLWSRARLAAGVQVIIHFPASNGEPPLARVGTVTHCRGQDGTGFAIGCRFDTQSKVGAA